MTEQTTGNTENDMERTSGNAVTTSEEILRAFLENNDPYFETANPEYKEMRMSSWLDTVMGQRNLFAPGTETYALQTHFREVGWLPESLQEARMVAVDSQNARIDRAARTHVGNGERAVEETYRTIHGYWQSARNDVQTLNRGRVEREGHNLPDVDLIRSDEGVMTAMAEYLYALREMNMGKWYGKNGLAYDEQKRYCLGIVLALCRYGSPDDISRLFLAAWESSSKRFNYLSKTKHELETNNPHLISLISNKEKVVGSLSQQATGREQTAEQSFIAHQAPQSGSDSPGEQELGPRHWSTYMPALEGTVIGDSLVTDEPVEVKQPTKRPEEKTSRLFRVDASKVHFPRTSKPKKGIRANFRDNTDYSDKALKSGLKVEPEAGPANSDADIDEVFGPPQPQSPQ